MSSTFVILKTSCDKLSFVKKKLLQGKSTQFSEIYAMSLYTVDKDNINCTC